jgi:hypothetical protein
MTTYLRNYLSGTWQPESSIVHSLVDPVNGQELAVTGGKADNLGAGFSFARTAGAELRPARRHAGGYPESAAGQP